MFTTKGNSKKVQNLSLSVSLCHRKAVVRRRNSSTFLHRLSFQLSFFQMRKVQKSQPLYLKLGLSANFSFYVFLSISVHHCMCSIVAALYLAQCALLWACKNCTFEILLFSTNQKAQQLYFYLTKKLNYLYRKIQVNNYLL